MSRRGILAFVLVAAVAALALWRLSLSTSLPQAKAQMPAANIPVPVTAGVVAARDVPQYLQGIGTVQAYNTVTVASRVDGAIVEVAFKEGQEVKKGTLLYQIDPRPYQAALEQAKANKLKDEAQLATAKTDLARYGSLVGKGYQTRQSYEEQQGLVAQDKAAAAADQAQIDSAKLNLGYAAIRSPIDGRLGARLVDIGNLVHAATSTPLVTITQLKPIFVSFTLPQATLDPIRAYQQKSPLDVIAYSGDNKKELAKGKLTLIDNAIDQSTGTIHLKATYANEDERLWPGEFVNVRVVLRMRRGVPTVPAQTVQQGPDGDYAYVIRKDDTVERRNIEVAATQEGLAVVTKGLKPGERIVVDGQFRLTDGARVRIAPPPKNVAG
ncbi:MAG TPA: efflux RND transporter periplasmic adaptor subunit [Stellaceae bacterium]|nr:efflux RND transporter periplasmic adaptor subunit [Stellaceae bacterium]